MKILPGSKGTVLGPSQGAGPLLVEFEAEPWSTGVLESGQDYWWRTAEDGEPVTRFTCPDALWRLSVHPSNIQNWQVP